MLVGVNGKRCLEVGPPAGGVVLVGVHGRMRCCVRVHGKRCLEVGPPAGGVVLVGVHGKRCLEVRPPAGGVVLVGVHGRRCGFGVGVEVHGTPAGGAGNESTAQGEVLAGWTLEGY